MTYDDILGDPYFQGNARFMVHYGEGTDTCSVRL